jgi:hypothetical protein
LILLSNDQSKSMASIHSISPFAFEGIWKIAKKNQITFLAFFTIFWKNL